MAIISARYRRHQAQRRNRQLVVFGLRQERFALPIQVAQRVFPLPELYGAALGGHLGLVSLNQQQVPVLDIEYQIFGDRPSDPQAYRYVLVLENPFGESMGLLLCDPPMLCRVTEGALQPVPPSYAVDDRMQCIAALVVLESQHPIFLINPAQLFPNYTSALPGRVDRAQPLQLEARPEG